MLYQLSYTPKPCFCLAFCRFELYRQGSLQLGLQVNPQLPP